MAGSGGGTAQGLADYQQDAHFLMMAASSVDETPVTWDGTATGGAIPYLEGSYAEFPSVLRFILEKGTTDVGGNPYEGVSTYDPGEALDALQEKFDDYMDKVDNIDSDADWGSILDLVQAEQNGQVPELDVDAIFTGVIGNSLSRALQLASQAYATAKSDGRSLMDSVVAQADAEASLTLATAEAEADASSDLLTKNARAEAAGGMTDARTAFGMSEADTQVDVDNILGEAVDKAVAKTAELVEGDASLGTSLSFMSNQAKDDISGGMAVASEDAKTDAEGVIDQIATKVSANEALAEAAGDNAYTPAEADAKTGMSSLIDAAASAIRVNEDMLDSVDTRAALKALARVQNADRQADISSADVMSDINTIIGSLGKILSDNIRNDAEGDAKTSMTSLTADAASAKKAMEDLAFAVSTKAQSDSQGVLDHAIINAKNHADTLSAAQLAKGWDNADMTDDKALASAKLTLEDAIVDSESRALASASSAETMMRFSVKDTMTDIMRSATPDVAPLIQASIQDALSGAQSAVSMAIESAEAVIESAPITKAVAAYRRRALTEHLRTVNSFAGGMSDINAVNSSAFIIGMALREDSFEGKILDYQADLESKLFAGAFPAYIETFKGIMSSYIESYSAQQAHMIQIAAAGITSTTQLFITSFTQCVETYMRGFVEYIGLYKDAASTYAEDARTLVGADAKLYEGLHGNIMGAGTQLAGTQSQITQAAMNLRQSMVNSFGRMQMEIYTQVLTSYINTEAGIFNAGMSTSSDFGNMQVGLVKDIAGLRQRLMSDLSQVYAGVHSSTLNTQVGATTEMARSGFSGVSQVGNSKTAVAKELVNNYLRTYIDLIGHQNASASVFSTMGKDKIAAFKDVLTAKLETFSRLTDKELEAFSRNFSGHLETAGGTLKDHFRGTVESRLREKGERQNFVNTHTNLLHNMSVRELESHRAAALLSEDLQKLTVISRGEQYEKDLEFDVRSAAWDMELFQMGGNVLSSVTGSVIPPAKGPTKTQSVIGGMAVGAGQGALIGTEISPGLGSGIGAGVGGLLGAIAGAQ